MEVSSSVYARRVIGVAALLSEVSAWLAATYAVCTVRGEISGLTRAASGHCYFNLKDADGEPALLRCVMFRRAAALLAFAPADGQLVEVRSRLGAYEPRGELQLVVEAMQRAGAGALYEQFLANRARLDALGLFDPARKRALPRHPQSIGVVTSLGAAALHDVLSALSRRAANVRVVVYPCLVQGAEAPASISAAIAMASARSEVDALVVCRGGGSLEDLWAFNDERVVRAIAAAAMPVVCGVGHETDITLADLAADLRAPTPTAAAELVAPEREASWAALAAREGLLTRRLQAVLDQHTQRLDRAAFRLARPEQGVLRRQQDLRVLSHRLVSQAPRQIAVGLERCSALQRRLQLQAQAQLASSVGRVSSTQARLHALDPHRVLARGFAWLEDEHGVAVSSIENMGLGDRFRAVLVDGAAEVQVTARERRP